MKNINKIKGMKHTILTLLFLCTLCISQAQVFGTYKVAPPLSAQTSSGGWAPFSGPSRVVPDDPGDEKFPGGGGETDPIHVNDPGIPVGDIQWLLPLLAIGYGVYNRKKLKIKNHENVPKN